MTEFIMVGSILSSIRKSFVSSGVKNDASQRIRSVLGRGFHVDDRIIAFPYNVVHRDHRQHL